MGRLQGRKRQSCNSQEEAITMIKDHTKSNQKNRNRLSGSDLKLDKNRGGGVKRLSSIQSPPVKWQYVKNYQLKNLKTDFGIPEFQRKTSSKHINEIVRAILKNEFYDNVIRFYK